jgi:restriction endonuclease S subunit
VSDSPPYRMSTTLGEVGKWGSGGTPKSTEASYYGGDIPWIRSGDLPDGPVLGHQVSITKAGLDSSSAKWVPEGALLIALYGATIGKLGITTYPVTTNQAVAYCVPDETLTSAEFLFWYLLSARTELIALAQGGAQPNISQTILKSRSLVLTQPNDQRRIVAKLDSLFKRSKKTRDELACIPRLVERYKGAILAVAFRGELTQEWRIRRAGKIESASSMVAQTLVPTQPRGGREAAGRVIRGIAALSVNDPGTSAPEGWSWVPLTRIARQETGHTPSRSHPEWWGGDVPWIGIKDAHAHHGTVITDTLQTTNAEGLANSAARMLPAGTVCLSRTASVGYVLIMGRPMATSQDFVTWTCTGALLPKFLMYALMAEGDEIRRFGKGSTHTTIYFPEVRALHICLAPIEEQRVIVECIEAAFIRVDKLAAEAQRAALLLNRLDQATLAKAFRGDLVRHAETLKSAGSVD